MFNTDTTEVIISGEEFEQTQILLFPTIHLGWQF